MATWSTTYEDHGLIIVASRAGDTASVAWKGESDARNPSMFLNPIMHRLAKDFAGRDVTVDFSGLHYLNSATVAPLLGCIKAFVASANSVTVTFSDQEWQRPHLQCVRAISRSHKHMQVLVKEVGGS